MPQRLWFDLTTVLHMAETAVAAPLRVNVNGAIVADMPPALHLIRVDSWDRHRDDQLYIDGNFYPSLNDESINAEPFRSTYHGRRYGHGITWTEWLGRPPRGTSPIQARFPLLDDTRLLDLLRAGHAAGFDIFTVDADGDAGLTAAVARRRRRSERPRPGRLAGSHRI